MRYVWIVLTSGHLIKVESETFITFADNGWSNEFTGEIYASDGKTLITSSMRISYRKTDAIVYT
jgi:hypothetical protein